MIKIIVCLLSFFSVAVCFAQTNQTESLTITTYYPSPYGVYRDLEIHRSIKMKPVDLSLIPNPTNGTIAINQSDNSLWVFNQGWQSMSASGGSPLVNSLHTQSDCTSHPQHGQLVATEGSFKQCKFNLPGCPSGWRQYNTYGVTTGNTCAGQWWPVGNDCLPCQAALIPVSCTNPARPVWGTLTFPWCTVRRDTIMSDISGCSCNQRDVPVDYACPEAFTQIGCY